MYKNKIIVSCPVCNNTDEKLIISEYTSKMAANHFCPVERNSNRNQRMLKKIEQLWQCDKAFFVRCEQCSLGFCTPYIGGDEEYYNIHNESMGYPTTKWDYNYALKYIKKTFLNGQILDIGAGVGNFLKKLDNSLWRKYATEGSEQPRQQLLKQNILVLDYSSSTTDLYQNSFDVITIFQVLELISEFRSILDYSYKILRKEGLLIVAVPNCDSIIYQEKILGCPDMPPFHVNKWSPKSLAMALEHSGFNIIESKEQPISFDNLTSSLYLKFSASAKNPMSFSHSVHNLKNKLLRRIGVLVIMVGFFFILLPSFIQIASKRHFIIIAQK